MLELTPVHSRRVVSCPEQPRECHWDCVLTQFVWREAYPIPSRLSSICPSLCLSVCLSVRPSTFFPNWIGSLRATFGDVNNIGLNGLIFGPFWTPKYVKILAFFGHVLKKFSLVSHLYCFTCSLHVLLDVWRIYGPQRFNFWDTLGPQISKNSDFGHFLSKPFHRFRISLGLQANLSYF